MGKSAVTVGGRSQYSWVSYPGLLLRGTSMASHLVGFGVRVDKLHVKYAVCPPLPQVPDDQVPPLLGIHLFPRMFVGYYRLGLHAPPAPHSATWCDERVVVHVSWC